MIRKPILWQDGKGLFGPLSAQVEACLGIEKLQLGHPITDEEKMAIRWCANGFEQLAHHIPFVESSLISQSLIGWQSDLRFIAMVMEIKFGWKLPDGIVEWSQWYRDVANRFYDVLDDTTRSSKLEELMGVLIAWSHFIEMKRPRKRGPCCGLAA